MRSRLASTLRLSLPVLGASGAKALLQIVVAAAIVSGAAASDAAAIFQLLFLQATGIALISAAGYMQGFAVGDDETKVAELITVRLALSALVLGLVAAMHCALPSGTEMATEKALIAIGAVASGLLAPLQGYVVRKRGNLAGFGPSVLVAGLALVPAMAFARENATLALFWLTFSQVGTLVLMALRERQVLHVVTSQLRTMDGGKFLASFRLLASVGAANTAGMLVVFLLREYWSAHAAPQVAAVTFFVLRIADSVLGVSTLLMVRLDLKRYLSSIQGAAALLALLAVLAIGLSSIHAAFRFFTLPASVLLAQVIVELMRYASAAAYVLQSSDPRSLRYLAFVLGPQIIAGTLVFATGWIDTARGLQSFLFVVALTGLAIHSLQKA